MGAGIGLESEWWLDSGCTTPIDRSAGAAQDGGPTQAAATGPAVKLAGDRTTSTPHPSALLDHDSPKAALPNERIKVGEDAVTPPHD